MEKIILSGMPEPMLQPLYARAKESQTHGALHDDTAVRLVQQLDYNFDFSSKDAAMHNGVIARALVLDKLVSTYLAQHPGAVVNITCRASPCFLHIFYNTANPIFSGVTHRTTVHQHYSLFFTLFTQKAGLGAISAPGPALFPIPNFSLLIPN